jgi:uncharacterized membrane protein
MQRLVDILIFFITHLRGKTAFPVQRKTKKKVHAANNSRDLNKIFAVCYTLVIFVYYH